MLNVDRYRRINVNATTPGEVYLDYSTINTTERLHFLARCVQRFTFADRATGREWALVEAVRTRIRQAPAGAQGRRVQTIGAAKARPLSASFSPRSYLRLRP